MATANSGTDSAKRERPAKAPARPAKLVDKVKSQTARLTDQGLARAAQLAEERKEEAAKRLDSAVEVIRNLADAADQQFGGAAAGVVHRGGDAVEKATQKLRANSVGEIVEGTGALIARHPGVAIGTASAIGFLAGRILKGGLSDKSEAPSKTRDAEVAA